MKRAAVLSLLALAIVAPAGIAASLFSAPAAPAKPCFAAGDAAYVMASGPADYTVRIDNAAARPTLRLQLVDDPAVADFVMADDGEAPQACVAGALKTVRIDDGAQQPDLTVALSRSEGGSKVFVHSTNFTEQEAAALFAVIWHNTRRTQRMVAR